MPQRSPRREPALGEVATALIATAGLVRICVHRACRGASAREGRVARREADARLTPEHLDVGRGPNAAAPRRRGAPPFAALEENPLRALPVLDHGFAGGRLYGATNAAIVQAARVPSYCAARAR